MRMEEEKMTGRNTIWLKPKPTHIDENFEAFLLYLKSGEDEDSALYKESVKLLNERVEILLNERFASPVYRHSADMEALRFNVRLCGAWLIMVDGASCVKRKTVLLTLINQLIQICLMSNKTIGNKQTFTFKSVDSLLAMALSIIIHKIPERLELNWNDIIQPEERRYTTIYGNLPEEGNKWSVDKFIEHFLKNEFKEIEDSVYEGKGTLVIESGEIKIVALPQEQYKRTSLKNSLVENDFIPAWRLSIYSDKRSHIKDSKKEDVETIEECIESIVAEQQKCKKLPKSKFLHSYEDKEEVAVEITDVGAKYFTVRTVNPDYKEIVGRLILESNLYIFKKNYPYEMWKEVLGVGTRIKAKYNESGKSFSITDDFIEFIKCDVEIGTELKCQHYRDVRAEDGFYEFVSEDGYIVFVPLTPEQEKDIDEDGHIIVKVFSYNEEKSRRGCMKASYVCSDDNPKEIEPEAALRSLINDYIHSWNDLDYEEADETSVLDEHFIKEICQTLNMMQSRESNPGRRYKLLSVIKLLGEMGEFEKESQYATYLSKYIKTLILFAGAEKEENKCIKSIEVPPGLENNETIISGTEILKILSCFSMGYESAVNQVLNEYVDSDNELISRTASLVQSYNRLKDLLEERTLKGIKRQILEGLSLVIDGDSNLDLSNKHEVSFGEEDDIKEFKHSFFFAPNSAREQRQEYTVCKAICGMMNNRGGIVYLGVGEDQDGIGRPVGLERDLEELSRQFRVRSSLDDYVVHINRKCGEWLGETAWSYVTIKQDREYNIVKIIVEPYPYDVVYLTDGKSYLRKNNSTEEIREESTIEDIRRRRQEALRKVDDKLINLQDAIRKNLKVRLLGYRSSSSETISNRVVEPFSVVDNDYVICYEEEESKVKMFRLSRIDKVAVTDERWTHSSKHKKPFIDIFHMAEDVTTNGKRIRVVLKLKLRAKNALCEMYPKAADCMETIDRETWKFETVVTSLLPIMHFYLNYAESVEIVEAPGLLDAIRVYLMRYIPVLEGNEKNN